MMKKFLIYFPVLLFFGLLTSGNLTASEDITLQEVKTISSKINPEEAFLLARLYETGNDTIAPDTIQSRALYLRAAEQGYTPAMNYTGFLYYRGELFTQNTDSALFWIGRAAEKGDITAAANLGYLYSESPIIPQDISKAVKWLTIASEKGVKETQIKLAQLKRADWEQMESDSLLYRGITYYTGKSPILGVAMLEIAAEKNSPKAQALLGEAYSKGLGVPYNHDKAIQYFFKAAINDDPVAQFILAELLEIFPDALSDIIEESGKDAELMKFPEYWYDKAAGKGVIDSDTAYKLLYSYP